jgi:hypothetical protein
LSDQSDALSPEVAEALEAMAATPTTAERPPGPEVVEPGLEYGVIFYSNGWTGKDSRSRSEIKDADINGNALAFALSQEGSRYVHVFCPFHMRAWQVSRDSLEYRSLRRAEQPIDRQRIVGIIHRNWADAARRLWQRDFDVAAMVLRALGAEVPVNALPEGTEAKTTGGKEADVLGLLKPVKRGGRRAEVLSFFLEGEGGKRSIHEATAKFGISRSNLLSQCYLLQKDHGIGYSVMGDAVQVTLPEGVTDPFAA